MPLNNPSPRPYRAICTDIDGTLLNAERVLSARTISVIKELPTAVPVLLASSRMPKAMRHLQQDLGILHQPLICYNGGLILDFADDKNPPAVLASVQIPLEICQTVVGLAQGTQVHISLYQNDNWFAPQLDQWTTRETRNTLVFPTISALADVLLNWEKTYSGAHKIMCMGPEEEIAALAQNLQDEVGHEIFIYKSKATYLELAPRSVSKATALDLLLKQNFNFGMHEVIAFGDNYNDMDLLQAVGLGIAVGNARTEVKAVAQEIAPASTADGVAMSIEKYFLDSF